MVSAPSAPAAPPAEPLIAGRFAVDPARPLPGAGGGVPACAAADRLNGRTDLMALAVQPGLPPRARALQGLIGAPAPGEARAATHGDATAAAQGEARLAAQGEVRAAIDGMLVPLGQGPDPAGAGGGQAWYVICPAPPGPALGAALAAPWPEAALLGLVLRPAALALRQLAARGLTHRAIRPDNVFQAGPGQAAVLGAAWADPPAARQPAVYEPPYVAFCAPSARGEGSIADDVYALGVLLLTLATGRVPLAGRDAATVVRRKLELGSYAALVGEDRLPPLLADLLRGMLAEDPEHRPPPALLADPMAARARRVAARPPRHAQHPLRIGAIAAGGARALAHALAVAPQAGLRALRSGAVDLWLRRELGDATLSVRLEEVLRLRSGGDRERGEGERAEVNPDTGGADVSRLDALLLVRAVAVLDPLAPLCWPGAPLWPDGLGPALAAAQTGGQAGAQGVKGTHGEKGPQGEQGGTEADAAPQLIALILAEAAAAWAEVRAERCDVPFLRAQARQWRALVQLRGPSGGPARLTYLLNPLLPCDSKLLAGRWVARLADLPPALEAVAGTEAAGRSAPVDAAILAFVAARAPPGSGMETDVPAAMRGIPILICFRLLAVLQLRFHPAPLPALARWLAGRAGPLLDAWRNAARRAERAEQLTAMAEAGQLAPMLALLQDPAGRSAEERDFHAARAERARLDAELAAIADGAAARAALARQWGQEIAAGIGLAVLALVLGMAALG